MFHVLERRIQNTFHRRIQERYGADIPVVIEQPRQSDFGEIALPAAFQLAKVLKQAPRRIASELLAGMAPIPGVAALEVAGNGYINVRFDRGAYAQALLKAEEQVRE